jgi:nitrogen regulatory protein PII
VVVFVTIIMGCGLAGDGKIYVSEVEDAIRIATGDRGEGAV